MPAFTFAVFISFALKIFLNQKMVVSFLFARWQHCNSRDHHKQAERKSQAEHTTLDTCTLLLPGYSQSIILIQSSLCSLRLHSTECVLCDLLVEPIVWKMNEDDRLRSLMFTMTYMLMKRRRDVNNINIQRRNEIQRRVRHRQYFLQRQKRMLMVWCLCLYVSDPKLLDMRLSNIYVWVHSLPGTSQSMRTIEEMHLFHISLNSLS